MTIYYVCEVFWRYSHAHSFEWFSLIPIISFSSGTFLQYQLSVSQPFQTERNVHWFPFNRIVICRIFIVEEPLVQVDSFKYLGVVLQMNCPLQSMLQPCQKKPQQRLHDLRRLRSFNVEPKHLLRLYRSIIEPLITNCSICYQASKKSPKLPPRSLVSPHKCCPKGFWRMRVLSLTTDSSHTFMLFRLEGDAVARNAKRSVVLVTIRMLNKLCWCLPVYICCGYIFHFNYFSLTVLYT